MNVFSAYTLTSLFAMATFAFVTSVTPGPNNLMLLHSGARFGFKRTIPHMVGIASGFCVMILLCCIGVAVVLGYPATNWMLKIIGSLYMLGWRLNYGKTVLCRKTSAQMAICPMHRIKTQRNP